MHLVILGYAAVVLAGLIIYARTRPDQKFTKWQVVQVALLFMFALTALSGLTEEVLPKMVDAAKAWLSK